ncbi:MAG: sulfite exporter TauE/SafE family protein [Actinobacteria bacterium]|nr:sulfite exporter TauE/SafE family protein [Actinomycetota bacterium]
MPEWWQVALTIVAGAVTGVLSGMFGIGGAIISNPALRALGAGPRIAVGSTLPAIIPGALTGALRYQREGLVIRRVFLWTAPFGIVSSVGGAIAADAIPEPHALTLSIALVLIFTSFRVARAPVTEEHDLAESDAEAATRSVGMGRGDYASRPKLAVTGLLAGGLSGLLGIGGGVLMVPMFTGWVRMALKPALATSLACVGVLAIPGTISHAALGHIDWGYAIPLAVGIVPGARLGAHITIGLAEHRLRVIVGGVLGVIAVVYGIIELIALI